MTGADCHHCPLICVMFCSENSKFQNELGQNIVFKSGFLTVIEIIFLYILESGIITVFRGLVYQLFLGPALLGS